MQRISIGLIAGKYRDRVIKCDDLGYAKEVVMMEVMKEKVLLIETLNIVEDKNIDFVDALICAKSRLQGYGKLSFDKDVNKKC